MSDIPQAVIDAAAEEANIARWRARLVLEAAAPHIAAAERERIRQLAIEHDATCKPAANWQETNFPAIGPFADLLEQP